MSLLALVGLTGCAPMIQTAPDVVPATSSLGPISGSNFGGHAPIVGAHIYVLQAGTGGYGTIATSLLNSGSAQYPIKANVNDPNIPTSQSTTGGFPAAWNYVTTDNSGNFNITGDYSCTPGLPVYIYGYGGTPAIAPSSFVTAYSVTGTTVTLTSNALLSNGQSVKFANFTGALASLNSGTYTVANSTLTTFQVTATGLSGSGSLSNVTVSPVLNNNPNIVNMAVLGNCPTTGATNFSSLSFVFMNEVSTVAAAYSLSGFFSNSGTSLTSTDAVHLAIPLEGGQAGIATGTSPAWVGLENAALNAAVLYDIQGSVVGTSGDGEAHIANSTTTATPNSGVVPQALINSLANVLASCVDSNSTSTTTSVPCTSLFSKLGSTVGSGGVPSGTAPVDTATAAIDMAHNPGNSNASTILGLATGTVPFTPTVVAGSSTDLVIGITWPVPSTQQSGTLVQGAFNDYVGSSAIDSKGNVWVSSYQGNLGAQGYLMEYDHLGNQLLSRQLTYNPEVLALDNSNNLWILPNGYLQAGTSYGVYEYTAATNYRTLNYFNNAPLQNPESMVIDGQNNVYITAFSAAKAVELSSTGALKCTYNVNTNQMWGVGLDKSSNVWLAAWGLPLQEWSSTNCNVNGGNARTAASTGTIGQPQVVAFDANGVGWVTDRTQGNILNPKSLNRISTTGALTSFTGGGLNTQGATALAVDGSGNILLGSWGSNALTSPNLFTIFNGTTNQFLTTTSGLTGNYQVTGSGTTTTTTEGFWFFAIDGSGNLWSNGNANLHEYIGVATPVLTPLAGAVKAGTLAAKP